MILQLAPAVVTALLYARRARTLAPTPRAVPGWRHACFFAGLVLIAGTVASPVGRLADELFWVHMTEHLVLADAGALRALAHPAVALPLWAANLYLWHVPALHEAAVRHEAVHALQHMAFIGFGANMWMPLFGPLPRPPWFGNLAKLGYIVAVRLVGAVLANVFVFGGDAFYDVYAPGERDWGISPAGDQNAAGGVMMVWESVLTVCLFGWLFLRSAREGEERQALLDLAGERGVELSEQRAGRAVAAGRGEELRRRIEDRG